MKKLLLLENMFLLDMAHNIHYHFLMKKSLQDKNSILSYLDKNILLVYILCIW